MKKHMKCFFAACLFLTACLFWLPAQSCKAAMGLEQIGAGEDSVTVRWERKEGALQYRIYVGTCRADSRLYAAVDASVMTKKIRGLAGGSSNYIRVDYEYTDRYGNVKTKLAGYMADARTLPGTVQNVRQTGWYDQAGSGSVVWDRMGCADGYEYKVKNSRKRTVAIGRVKSNTGTARINRVAASEVCTIFVRAYITIGGKEIYGGWSSVCRIFPQPRMKTIKISDGRLLLKWRRIKGASGYNVYVSQKGTGGYEKVKTTGASGNSVVISQYKGKKISQKNTYYIYVTVKKKAGKRMLEGSRYFYQNTKNKNTGYFS